MQSFSYRVKSGQGINAGPAGMIVGYAKMFDSDIKISCEGREADAKRLISLMTLGVREGDTIEVTVSGKDEEKARSGFENFCGRIM